MIISAHALNSLQLYQLNQLDELCQKVDKGAPALYRHILTEKRSSNNILLYYAKEQLIGFLSIYFFYHDAYEISVLVHPHHRRQKIATQLLQHILPRLIETRIQRLIFSSSASFAWLAKQGFSLIKSEYYMERDEAMPGTLCASILTIRHATINDIPILVNIDRTCFAENETNLSYHFAQLLKNPYYSLLIAHHEGKAIGKVHLRKQDETLTFLSNLAILPSFQGQGFGHALLTYAIHEAFKQGNTKLALEVTTNPESRAFNLYLRHGFKIILHYHYWTISLTQLRSLIL